MNNEEGVLDWDSLEPVDQARAQELLDEFNRLFNKYEKLKKEDETCEDFI
jgi:hypothetical protein